jgi:hypothetical protein
MGSGCALGCVDVCNSEAASVHVLLADWPSQGEHVTWLSLVASNDAQSSGCVVARCAVSLRSALALRRLGCLGRERLSQSSGSLSWS